jgi:prepilin signal peptidase PulO-like enzyme (type II secretory pathway)
MLLTYLVVILVGLIAGGINNVLADDLPHYRRPRLPRYPDDTLRPVTAWLGITAFLLKQRTSPGGARLSWRYPLTEIATIIGMVVAVAVKNNDPDVSELQLVFWLVYIAIWNTNSFCSQSSFRRLSSLLWTRSLRQRSMNPT